MKTILSSALVAASLVVSAAQAAPVTMLDFENKADGSSLGTAYTGITFQQAVARHEASIAPFDFTAAPSGDGVLSFEANGNRALGGLFKVDTGFTTGLSFWYLANRDVSVNVWGNSNGKSDLLSSLVLKATAVDTWAAASLALTDTQVARSVTFDMPKGHLFVDVLTLGATTPAMPATAVPQQVPEPAALVLAGVALAALAATRLQRR